MEQSDRHDILESWKPDHEGMVASWNSQTIIACEKVGMDAPFNRLQLAPRFHFNLEDVVTDMTYHLSALEWLADIMPYGRQTGQNSCCVRERPPPCLCGSISCLKIVLFCVPVLSVFTVVMTRDTKLAHGWDF